MSDLIGKLNCWFSQAKAHMIIFASLPLTNACFLLIFLLLSVWALLLLIVLLILLLDGRYNTRREKFWGFLTRSDTNQPEKSQKKARSLEFPITEEERFYYSCSEIKGADLLLCFHICKKWFSLCSSKDTLLYLLIIPFV